VNFYEREADMIQIPHSLYNLLFTFRQMVVVIMGQMSFISSDKFT